MNVDNLIMIDKLISKLYNSTVTKKELNELFGLLQDSNVKPSESMMESLWNRSQSEKYKIPLDQSEKIFGKFEQKKLKSSKNIGTTQRLRKLTLIYTIAASITLIIGFFSFFALQTYNDSSRTVQTLSGEQISLVLPDGSFLKLNANSVVTFKRKWKDDSERKVFLKGEAFFEVERKPDTDQKFEVITDGLIVEVLGTIFNVNTHSQKTVVFLDEGLVKLHLTSDSITSENNELMMLPGELVKYDKISGKAEKQLNITDNPSSWKDGIVTFIDVPLNEVLIKLQELYNVRIIVEKNLGERMVRTGIPIDNIDLALSVIAKTCKLTIVRDANTIKLIIPKNKSKSDLK